MQPVMPQVNRLTKAKLRIPAGSFAEFGLPVERSCLVPLLLEVLPFTTIFIALICLNNTVYQWMTDYIFSCETADGNPHTPERWMRDTP